MVALMKNRTRFIILGVILIFGLTSCQTDTSQWQTVEYNRKMSFKIPEEWVITKTDEGLVFSDRPLGEADSRVYMLEFSPYLLPDGSTMFDNSIIGSGHIIKETHGELSSISTYYSEKTVEINGKTKTMRSIYFLGSNDVTAQFLVIDEGLNSRILKIILSTFLAE